MKTYILGHTKPDTDAVVATLSLAHLYQHADCFGHKDAIPAIADPLNPETTFIFDKFNQTPPLLLAKDDISPDDCFVLVDHNEASQRMPGISDDSIVEIIDHHKINLNLNQPIFATFKPWGSTTTIIYHLMQQNQVKPSPELATLMLTAVLSDTVGYKSATTTDKDREVGQELAKVSGISDIDALTLEIFKAKSNVSRLTPAQIVKNDYKVFDFARKTFIDQLETVEQAEILKTKKAELLEAMTKVKAEEGVELLFVAITDILNVNTKLLIVSPEEASVATKAFGGKVEDNILDIGPKLSRKKEIAPAIENALKV